MELGIDTVPVDQQRRSLLDQPAHGHRQAVVGPPCFAAGKGLAGRPLEIGWLADNLPAILEIWDPGTMAGTAVAPPRRDRDFEAAAQRA